ncbi:MAG: phage/plasmid primase, P4 family, partial [Candidatus Tectomicrobia bacterium]
VSGSIGDDGTIYALEIKDFDESGLYEEWYQEALRIGLGDLIARLPAETTPSGGAHTGYLCATIEGNQKLAMRDAMTAELTVDPKQKVKVRIETRGEGGLCIVAPTPPGIHPENPENGYVMIQGSWADIPIITPEERQKLFALSRSYQTSTIAPNDATAKSTSTTTRTPLQSVALDPAKPGDDLNMRADRAWWKTLLEPHSWKHLRTRTSDDVELWQRPGKDGPDASATLGATGNGLYVFSTSAAPLEGQRVYSPFSAYIRLEHGGDEKSAAKALAALGYGTPATNGATPDEIGVKKFPPGAFRELPETPLSDVTNGEKLVEQHGKDLRYCYPWKKWLVWTGTHWSFDDTGALTRRCKATVKDIMRCATYVENETVFKAMMAHAHTSFNAQRIAAMATMAQSEPGVAVLPDTLDTHHWLINCRNGTLDLHDGTLRPPQREDLLTYCLDIAYDPDATCPTWERFLDEIMGGNTTMVDFLQRAVGYSLTGDVREQVLFILHGNGSNGKSTFINTLLSLFKGYAMKAPAELLMVSGTGGHDRHPTEKAGLAGKRFVAAIETEEGRRLAEVLVKELTGSDKISARRMREDFWEFWPTHKIWLATNYRPEIRGTDEAIWRRVRLIPFTESFEDDRDDKSLPDKLMLELPGILAWIVKGCEIWRENGLGLPDEVRAATAGYRADMDTVQSFLAEICHLLPQARVKSSELYAAYEEWGMSGGGRCLNPTNFGKRLTELGYQRVKNVCMWYEGIGLPATTGGTGGTGIKFPINSKVTRVRDL